MAVTRSCPGIAGLSRCADTIEEAQANVVEAAEGWLEVWHDQAKEAVLRDMYE